MSFHSAKLLRRFTILLVAVFVMLRVGAAFAACLSGMEMAQQPMGSCCALIGDSLPRGDAGADAGVRLCENQCTQLSAVAQHPMAEVSTPGTSVPIWAPRRIAAPPEPPGLSPSFPKRPYSHGHPLIHQLQRLLI